MLYRGGDFCYTSAVAIYFLNSTLSVRIESVMAKKAIIQTGGKQYVVTEGETFKVELVKDAGKTIAAGKNIDFEPLLVIDGDSVQVGTPQVAKIKVTAEVLEADVQADKVTAIRYKAKKRVHTVRGHRQHQTVLRINKIA
jgi:large subunit ribosomal protein L21